MTLKLASSFHISVTRDQAALKDVAGEKIGALSLRACAESAKHAHKLLDALIGLVAVTEKFSTKKTSLLNEKLSAAKIAIAAVYEA